MSYQNCIPDPITSYLGKDRKKGTVGVAVVEDDEHDRLFTERLLKRLRGFACAAIYTIATEALRGIPFVNPGLVLMDIGLPGMNGIECTRRLRLALPQLKIVMTSGLLDTNSMNQSVEAGANGYLTKPLLPAQCLAMFTFALTGGSAARSDKPCRAAHDAENHLMKLTAREIEVMDSLGKGQPYKEIASNLHISSSTVNFHLQSVFRKLQVSNKIEALNKLRVRGHLP